MVNECQACRKNLKVSLSLISCHTYWLGKTKSKVAFYKNLVVNLCSGAASSVSHIIHAIWRFKESSSRATPHITDRLALSLYFMWPKWFGIGKNNSTKTKLMKQSPERVPTYRQWSFRIKKPWMDLYNGIALHNNKKETLDMNEWHGCISNSALLTSFTKDRLYDYTVWFHTKFVIGSCSVTSSSAAWTEGEVAKGIILVGWWFHKYPMFYWNLRYINYISIK